MEHICFLINGIMLILIYLKYDIILWPVKIQQFQGKDLRDRTLVDLTLSHIRVKRCCVSGPRDIIL
jgi:hypothetical protein